MREGMKKVVVGGVFSILATVISAAAGSAVTKTKVTNEVQNITNIDNGDVAEIVQEVTERAVTAENEVENLKIELEDLKNQSRDEKAENKEYEGEDGTDVVSAKGTTVDIITLSPYVGDMKDIFSHSSQNKDNYGNTYNGYRINCSGFSEPSVGVALRSEYSKVRVNLGLAYDDKDINNEIWLVFFDGDSGTQLGESKRFTKGSEPQELEVSVEGVDKLIVEIGATDIHTHAYLLTDGIFLE